MARSKQERPRFATVEEALNLRNVEDLKQLVALLPTTERPTRKGELVKLILRYLEGDHLRARWQQLDETQQNAVRETLYSAEGFFNAERFLARYGSLPNFGEQQDDWGYRINPSLLRLFIYGMDRYNNHYPGTLIPEDLQERLRAFVSPPAPPKLETVDELPEFFERIEKEYEFSDDPADIGPTVYMRNRVFELRRPRGVREIVHRLPLQRRDTERAAAQDVVTLLRLVDKAKLAVSDKTLRLMFS